MYISLCLEWISEQHGRDWRRGKPDRVPYQIGWLQRQILLHGTLVQEAGNRFADDQRVKSATSKKHGVFHRKSFSSFPVCTLVEMPQALIVVKRAMMIRLPLSSGFSLFPQVKEEEEILLCDRDWWRGRREGGAGLLCNIYVRPGGNVRFSSAQNHNVSQTGGAQMSWWNPT